MYTQLMQFTYIINKFIGFNETVFCHLTVNSSCYWYSSPSWYHRAKIFLLVSCSFIFFISVLLITEGILKKKFKFIFKLKLDDTYFLLIQLIFGWTQLSCTSSISTHGITFVLSTHHRRILGHWAWVQTVCNSSNARRT